MQMMAIPVSGRVHFGGSGIHSRGLYFNVFTRWNHCLWFEVGSS